MPQDIPASPTHFAVFDGDLSPEWFAHYKNAKALAVDTEAMGLIHGNHYQADVESYLLEKLRASQGSEVLQHGACLGLGLSCMGTQNRPVVEEVSAKS